MSTFHSVLTGREHGPVLRRKFLSALTFCFPLASLWIIAAAGVVPALKEGLLIPPASTSPSAVEPAAARLTVTIDYARPDGPLEKGRLLNGSEGGYEAMRNLNWLPEAYDKLAAIDFQMVRLDHLTNDKLYRVVSRDETGRLRFDFTRLDRVIEPMLRKGMRPLMCLCYTPDVLKPGDAKRVISDLDEWAQVVKAYVRHYRDRRQSGWYWEVWNEPDQESFFRGDSRRYVELYAKTAAAVKEVDPAARIGGAADSDPSSPGGKLGPLLEHVLTHPDVPLDFVSFHRYLDPDYDGRPPYDLKWNDDVVASMANFPRSPRPEVFVTEWNLSPKMDSGPGADSDTNVLAAGAAVMMSKALMCPGLTRVFYFSPIEGFQPTRILNGDLGLLTVNNHKKAVYNLFEMIARLGDTFLRADIRGENTGGQASFALATREKTSQKTSVLVWNYRDREARLNLSVDNLPYKTEGKNIKVTRYLIDADHANFYKDIQAGLRGYKVGPAESLDPVESRVEVSAGTFVRTEKLAPFSVSLYVLEPSDLATAAGPVDPPAARPKFNHAASKPVTASSSAGDAGWGGEFLVDEITHSLPGTLGWGSAGLPAQAASVDATGGEWVMVDLGMAVTVDTVKLYPRDDQEHEGEGFPVDFKIQGAAHPGRWVDLVVRTDYGSGKTWNAVQLFSFPPEGFRYIRVVATRVSAAAGNGADRPAPRFQLAEMEVYGPDVDRPALKDYGLKDYVRLSKDLPHSEDKPWRLVCGMPYNCQFQPWIQAEGPGGRTIRFNSSNPLVLYLTPTETVTTAQGERTYEAKDWVSGEGAIYTIPAGVTVKAVKYRETGYDTAFTGSFECNDDDYNILWRKGARTVYLCMRDHFYDCPDRERVGFWGDGTPELNQCFYLFDSRAHRLCKDLVLRKLEPDFYPGQHLEFLGEYGLWFYYLHTGDLESLRAVYDPTKTFLLETYRFGNPRQWFDWGKESKDTAVIETCFYYIDMKTLRKIALATGHEADLPVIDAKLEAIRSTFDRKFWTGRAYMSKNVSVPDDRANAMAVNAGLADRSKWDAIYDNVLTRTANASCFFDRWVFEALCAMGRQEYALLRMSHRYRTMIPCRFTTLWEHYDRWWASQIDAFDEGSSLNHGWNPPVLNLSQTIAGVAPEAPGWRTYHVLPKEAFLTSIKVAVPSIRGPVAVDIKKTASAYSLVLTSPFGTTAVVGIPKVSFFKLRSIEVGGRVIWDGSYRGGVKGVGWNGEDVGYVKFNAEPGTWAFVGRGTLPIASHKPPPPPADETPLDKKAWTASASIPDGSFLFSGDKIPIDVAAANALDGDHWTGWRDMTNTQYPGQWFQVDMKQARAFRKIVLDNTWALWDSPKAYAVFVSNDGVNWGNPVATGVGQLGITTITFPAQTGRHVRITQTGADSAYHWSIYELDIYP